MGSNRRWRWLMVVLALVLVVSACSGDDGGDEADGDDTGESSGAPGALIAEGADVDVDPEILEGVSEWLVEESGLSDMLLEELFLTAVSTSGDVLHLTYDQQHGGVSVRGAQFIVHLDADGEVASVTDSLSETLPGEGTTEELSPEEAVEIATRAVDGTVVGAPDVVSTWLEDGTELRLGWEVRLSTRGPVDSLVVVVDATDGTVLTVASVLTRARSGRALDASARFPTQFGEACDLPSAPSACIFPLHPLADGDVADDLDDELIGVELPELDDPEGGELIGRFVVISSDVADDYTERDEQWGEEGLDGDGSVEAANAYFWMTQAGLAIERLGFDYRSDNPVDLIPIDFTGEADDNAFYDPQQNVIVFGVGSGGVDLAQDGAVAIHEYGHAVLDSQLPFIISSEGGALHEGFADALAFLLTASSLDDPACLGEWASANFGIDCFRRLDNDRVYPDDIVGEPHDDGEIYGGAIHDVFAEVLASEGLSLGDCTGARDCDDALDGVLETMLASLQFMTSDPGLIESATALAEADRVVYGGRYADAIETALAGRGLATAGGGDAPESMTEGDAVTVRIDHGYRGDLSGVVEVLDGGGETICEFELFAPDPADNGRVLTRTSPIGPDECAAHLPPSPERRWRLTVVDTLPEDEGKLSEFSVVADGVTYRSTGLPVRIPDEDPLGAVATIDGTTGEAPDGPDTPASGYVASISIDHSYHGDLSVLLGFVDPALGDDDVVCLVDALAADASDSEAGAFTVTVDVGSCATGLAAASPDSVWVVVVTDNAALDTGTVTEVEIETPDAAYVADGLPVSIPDDDPDGVGITIAV